MYIKPCISFKMNEVNLLNQKLHFQYLFSNYECIEVIFILSYRFYMARYANHF